MRTDLERIADAIERIAAALAPKIVVTTCKGTEREAAGCPHTPHVGQTGLCAACIADEVMGDFAKPRASPG